MITSRMIVDEVSQHYRISVEDILSHRDHPPLHLPRRMGWRLARDLTTLSLVQIGARLGGFDHTTVLYGIRKLSTTLRVDTAVSRDYRLISGQIAMREAANRPDDLTRDRGSTALEIAKTLLDEDLIVAPPTNEEVRLICQEVRRLSGNLAVLATTQSDMDLVMLRRTHDEQAAAIAAATPILAAARAVAASAQMLSTDMHTRLERGSRLKLETAVKALQTLFERT